MLDNLMENLFNNAKDKIKQEKKQLADKFIDFESDDKNIKFKVSANGRVKDLSINPDFFKEEPEMIEDMLVINLNKALEKAEELRNKELENLQSGILPNLDELLGSFGDMGDNFEEID